MARRLSHYPLLIRNKRTQQLGDARYLRRRADTKFVAGSPDQVARHILIEALEKRRQRKYLGVEFNPSSKRSDET